MKTIVLPKEQIHKLVSENRYRVDPKNAFLSRCIDGRYENKLKVKSQKLKVEERKLPALAIPGADLGELALILATGNSFGLAIDEEKAFKILTEAVGGGGNFSFHTDRHSILNHKNITYPKRSLPIGKKIEKIEGEDPAAGCGHWRQINLHPKAYNLEKDELEFIQKKITTLMRPSPSGNYVILEGEHREGAVVQVTGHFGLYPRFSLETEGGKVEVEVFVYHQSLVNERHRLLAKKLVENQAVKLYPGCDVEYLYEALSEMTENHLFETAKRLAAGLPIYLVRFADDGSFEIEEMGKVI